MARLYIAMSTSEWMRCVTYHLPLPTKALINVHAEFVASIFLFGGLSARA